MGVEVSHEWEQLSKSKPLWMHLPEDVTNEEYASFHKFPSNEWEESSSMGQQLMSDRRILRRDARTRPQQIVQLLACSSSSLRLTVAAIVSLSKRS